MARKGPAPLPASVANPMTSPPPEDADLLEHLAFQHRQLEQLWSELQVAHTRHLEHRPGARIGGHGQDDLARRIVALLSEHDALELELLYPVVDELVGQELAEHAKADHEEIRLLLDGVDGEDPADEEVFQAFAKIMSKTAAHIDEEERIAFPMLRALLAPPELRHLRKAPAGERSPGGEVAAPVIDLAAAERDQPVPTEPTKVGLAGRGRRLLRRH